MDGNQVITALVEQVACYRALAKLAELQHLHVQQGQTEQLLQVLKQRQDVLDRVLEHEKTIGPAKRAWPQFVASLNAESRPRAESLLAETRQLLEQITAADRNDAMVLQQRKINLGRQITKVGAARQINRNYATAAYGKKPPRMDISR